MRSVGRHRARPGGRVSGSPHRANRSVCDFMSAAHDVYAKTDHAADQNISSVISARICRHNATFSRRGNISALCSRAIVVSGCGYQRTTRTACIVARTTVWRVDGHNLHPLAIVTQPTSAAATPILLLFAGLWARPQPPNGRRRCRSTMRMDR
jgi:hypothetical protein